MPGDDFFERRPELFGEVVVAGVAQVFVERAEKPQGGVDGVVFGLFADVGEAVGNHARADVGGKGLEDAFGLGVAAGDQADPGQGDHGVTSPVGEPVITGEQGVQPVSAAHQELVGRAGEAGQQRVGCDGRGQGDALAAVYFGGEQRGGIGVIRLVGNDESCGCTRFQYQPQPARGEQILARVEAALLLARILKVVKPVGIRFPAGVCGAEMDGGLVGIGPIG